MVSDGLNEKNKNNLRMIVEGKVSGSKQTGPYARLLTYDAGEGSWLRASGVRRRPAYPTCS